MTGAGPDGSDRIALRGLRVRGHHGVYEHERRDGIAVRRMQVDAGWAVGRVDVHSATSVRSSWPRTSLSM